MGQKRGGSQELVARRKCTKSWCVHSSCLRPGRETERTHVHNIFTQTTDKKTHFGDVQSFVSFSFFPNGRFPGTRTCRHVRPRRNTKKPPNTGCGSGFSFFFSYIFFLVFGICWSATAILSLLVCVLFITYEAAVRGGAMDGPLLHNISR